MGLLKTVFEVNLGLFGKKAQDGYVVLLDCCPSSSECPRRTSGRTLLLFVIRDHIGTTPLANLQATLTADLNRIWDSLSKPDELKDRILGDYFDLSFTALPHKILAADQFEAEVRNLRSRFTDKTKDNYLFKPAYHKRIPADGVAFYMENIWVRQSHVRSFSLVTLSCRNKCKPTRTSICPPSKSSLRSSVAMRYPALHWPNSTSNPNRRSVP